MLWAEGYIYICVCVDMHIYIYMYIHIRMPSWSVRVVYLEMIHICVFLYSMYTII
jgi:hypothetical protein